jgi:radical SAM additional 4Fe4S-binding domain
MKILNNNQFFITEINENEYVFYNAMKHFATKLDKVALYIIDLIYTYKDIDLILDNIDQKHHEIVKEIYNKTEESGMLSIKKEKIPDLEKISSIPYQFYLHLTHKCNLKCTYCYNKDVRITFNDLELSDWYKIIDQIIPYANHIILTGGEPFLFKDIEKIVDYIKDKKENIIIEIISNCMHDFESGKFDNIFSKISLICFSCDSVSQVLERINFKPDVFVKNINYVKNKFPHLFVTLSTTYTKNGEESLSELLLFAKSNDCNSKFVIIIPNNADEKILMPSVERYTEKLRRNQITKKLNPRGLTCGASFGLCSVDAMGNLYPCQNLHYREFHLGNLLKTTFEEIYKRKSTFQKRAEFSVDNITICKECNLRYICKAGCRAATFRLEGNALNHPENLCEYYKAAAIAKLISIPL